MFACELWWYIFPFGITSDICAKKVLKKKLEESAAGV